MVVIIIPMAPSVNGLYSGKSRRYKSDGYKAWLLEAGHAINRQNVPHVEGRVSVFLEITEPKTKRATDLDNRCKPLLDILVKHGIIEGDSQHYVREIRMVWNAEIDGCRVTVTPIL